MRIIMSHLALALIHAAMAPSLMAATFPRGTSGPCASMPSVDDMIQRIKTGNAEDLKTATQVLIKHGKPAAAALVEALSDPDQSVRTSIATALRDVIAHHPKARPSDHGEKHWHAKIAKIKIGDRRKDVYRLLPPNPPLKPAQEHAGSMIGSGVSHTEWYRLDDYWTVSVGYRNPGSVAFIPELIEDPRRVWVDPPKQYTGEWNSWFVNGRKATCAHYKNGKYHGVLTWYRGNGRMIFEQNYEDGVITGNEKGWHEDGKKSYTGSYDKKGKRNGKWTHWFSDGQMQTRIPYQAGKIHGLSERWHRNGQLRYQDHYQNGVKHGVSRAFDMGGAVLWERLYRNGEIVESGK